MTIKRAAVVAFLTVVCLVLPTFAQHSQKGPIVIKEFKHDTGPLLREVAPLFPEMGTPSEHEIENNVNPNHPWSNKVQKGPGAADGREFSELADPELQPGIRRYRVWRQLFLQLHAPGQRRCAGHDAIRLPRDPSSEKCKNDDPK